MSKWKKANGCQYCGGELELQEMFEVEKCFEVGKDGKISQSGYETEAESTGSFKAMCLKCGQFFFEPDIRIVDEVLYFRAKE